ncbi:recombinase [Aerococcaceae bacterium WGS1372]
MARLYFGYKMVDGNIAVDEVEAKQLLELFQYYIEGDAIKTAGNKAGIDKYHGALGRLLRHEVYLGTEVYPQLINQELFDQVQVERQKRCNQLGRNFEPKEWKIIVPQNFQRKKGTVNKSNPLEEAEQYYQLIEVIE